MLASQSAWISSIRHLLNFSINQHTQFSVRLYDCKIPPTEHLLIYAKKSHLLQKSHLNVGIYLRHI